ncbi:MAG: PEP-CTERM sorting domain-containing protein, partial [Caldimonas sp.]
MNIVCMRAAGAAVFGLSMACVAAPAVAAPYAFSTGDPDGRMATASQPASSGQTEIEAADDFILGSPTSIASATFSGLLTGDLANLGGVVIEIYRVFPKDSVNPPSGQVPTRVNSPSDVAFASRSASASELSFATT